MSVEMTLSHNGHTALVQLRGDHDVTTVGELGDVLLADCDTAQLIVLDFGRTTFLDSAVLGVVVAGHRHAARRGARVIGVNADAHVSHVLRVTGIDDLLQMASDLAELDVELHPVETG